MFAGNNKEKLISPTTKGVSGVRFLLIILGGVLYGVNCA